MRWWKLTIAPLHPVQPQVTDEGARDPNLLGKAAQPQVTDEGARDPNLFGKVAFFSLVRALPSR